VKVEALQEDLFKIVERRRGHYEAVLEHTCFCAVAPRPQDVEAPHALLKKAGVVFGLFYAHGNPGSPPFDTTELEAVSGWACDRLGAADDGPRYEPLCVDRSCFPGSAKLGGLGTAPACRNGPGPVSSASSPAGYRPPACAELHLPVRPLAQLLNDPVGRARLHCLGSPRRRQLVTARLAHLDDQERHAFEGLRVAS
jgi:hypothetical protein